jgi:hypothetical protein
MRAAGKNGTAGPWRQGSGAEQWAWAYDSRADVYPTNEATQKWWSEAAAQFSYHEFVEPVDFSGFVFPSSGLFIMAKFPLGARFSGAQFLDGACFNYAQFGAAAEFDSAEFRSEAGFSHAEFLAEARFDGCRFSPAEGQPAGDGSLDYRPPSSPERAALSMSGAPAASLSAKPNFRVRQTSTAHRSNACSFSGLRSSEAKPASPAPVFPPIPIGRMPLLPSHPGCLDTRADLRPPRERKGCGSET